MGLLIFIVGGLAFLTIGVPDIPGRVRESIALHALNSRPTKPSFVRTLQVIGTSWNEGETFVNGEAYTGFSLPVKCKASCSNVMQVAFTHALGFCVVHGDVVTVYFDKNQRFSRFKVDSAADGC